MTCPYCERTPRAWIPFGIGDDQRVAGAALAIGVLFPAAERHVGRLRPAKRIIGFDAFRGADLVDERKIMSKVVCGAERLRRQRTIDIAVQRAFLAGAIVADDDDEQRIIELVDLL